MKERTRNEATEALRSVLKKAARDASFRAKCLSDPKAAIKEATGLDAPEGLEVVFVEPGSSLTIPLPPFPSSEQIEEDLLASISGGGTAHLDCGPNRPSNTKYPECW